MSKLQVDDIVNKDDTGSVGFSKGAVVTGIVTATGGSFSGNVSVGGVLTYEDVTNIDSVGVITARSDVSIADKIIHLGDTNTAIRFPAADTFTVETAGSEALRVDSAGKLLVGTISDASAGSVNSLVQVVTDDGAHLILGRNDSSISAGDAIGFLRFFGNDGGSYQECAAIVGRADGTHANNDKPTRLEFKTTSDGGSSATERVRIDSSGRLVIGSSGRTAGDVNAQLQVEGTSFATSSLNLISNAGASAGNVSHITLAKSRGSTDGSNTIIADGDNLGNIQFAGADGNDLNSVAALISAAVDGGPGSNDMPGRLVFSTTSNGSSSPSERVRIDSSGRLLVGATSSAGNAILTVQGLAGNTTEQGILAIRRSINNGNNNKIGVIEFSGGDNNQAAIIQAVGDQGWGTNDYPGRLEFHTTADGAASPTERMRINNIGTIGCFCSTTTSLIAATGAAAGTSIVTFACRHSASSTTAGTDAMYVYSNGNIVNTNNSYGALSDIKLKENIVDASSQWDDLKALQVRNYNFIEGQTHTQIGLVAQEVELVSPGLVTESPDRDEDNNDLGTVTKSVNYSVLYMKAVKALQEAMTRIETLEQRLTDAGL